MKIAAFSERHHTCGPGADLPAHSDHAGIKSLDWKLFRRCGSKPPTSTRVTSPWKNVRHFGSAPAEYSDPCKVIEMCRSAGRRSTESVPINAAAIALIVPSPPPASTSLLFSEWFAAERADGRCCRWPLRYALRHALGRTNLQVVADL